MRPDRQPEYGSTIGRNHPKERQVAECFPVVHRSTHGCEGFAGVEISPELTYDTGGLLDEARRLPAAVPLPNVMVQIPGTREALSVIRRLVGEGMAPNIARIVSLSGYVQAAEACVQGMKDRDSRGESLSGMTCAATVFLDSSELRTAMTREPEEYQRAFLDSGGRIRGEMAGIGIKALLSAHKDTLQSDEFAGLALKGARPPVPMGAWVPSGAPRRRAGNQLRIGLRRHFRGTGAASGRTR